MPTYRQIITEGIVTKIRSGVYSPGEKLPTRKELADEYQCSIEPVIRAQEDLEHAGWLETRQGKGVYVTERPADDSPSDGPVARRDVT